VNRLFPFVSAFHALDSVVDGSGERPFRETCKHPEINHLYGARNGSFQRGALTALRVISGAIKVQVGGQTRDPSPHTNLLKTKDFHG
jgi:hypothetical protein